MRVLVVEDAQPLAEAIAAGLRDQAIAADVAFDGATAEEQLAVNDYDVVILDRDLPLVHGDDICRSLASSGAMVRILMLTAAGEAAAARVTVDATPDPAGTVGDPVLLEHLALNLVRNGLRHNHPGGWVTVSTTARAQSGEAELVVANSGPVVPTEQIGALFEPFRRLGHGRDSGREGIGLGLSIVRSVVRAHGGRVRAESRDAGGLVVRVCLPATSGTVSSQGAAACLRATP